MPKPLNQREFQLSNDGEFVTLMAPSEEFQVKLYHQNECKYNLFTETANYDPMDREVAERVGVEAEQIYTQNRREAHKNGKYLAMKPFVKIANKVLPALDLQQWKRNLD